MSRKARLVQLLIQRGILSQQDSQRMELESSKNVHTILAKLIKERYGSKEQLGKIWGDSLDVSFVDLEKTLLQPEVVCLLPKEIAQKHNTILLYQFGDVVTAATSNPKNRLLLEELERLVGKTISPVLALEDDIKNAIEIHYKTDISLKGAGETISDIYAMTKKIVAAEDLYRIYGEQGVMDFCNALLLMGATENASDIHIEPQKNDTRVRFRLDGMLQERLVLEKGLSLSLASRLKIMAHLDIAERRRPQDGRINLLLSGKNIDFRLATLPTLHGEKITMRILGSLGNKEVPDLTAINFSKSIYEKTKRIIETPNGIFFVTGPTGSGKTTTLYAALRHLNDPEVNILTIEDPIEYNLPGINQVQIKNDIDFDFATALRSFLRHDPDIILVGEIRDQETAKIAVQAALTGHFVMTTMHTNNSIQAITRLVDIGVEPFLVAPSIVGALSQRLVRRICRHCKEEYQLSPREIEKIFLWDGKKNVSFFRSKGCPECNNTGYSGRIGIHELLYVNDEIRSLIAENAAIVNIEKCVRKYEFQSIRYDGIKKVLRGLTTIDEVNRVTFADTL